MLQKNTLRISNNMKNIIKNFIFFLLFLFFLSNCSGTKPVSVGQLSPCPDKPNCVSSKSSLETHKIAPITYEGTSHEAQKKMLKVLHSMPRAKIITNKKGFIHIEFTSKIFRFVDDVEFYFEEKGVIHFRSASRIGHSDMGVNRRRMESVHQAFSENIRPK